MLNRGLWVDYRETTSLLRRHHELKKRLHWVFALSTQTPRNDPAQFLFLLPNVRPNVLSSSYLLFDLTVRDDSDHKKSYLDILLIKLHILPI